MLFNGDKRKIDAYNELIRLGILIPLTNVELYHGRANTNETGEWQVISEFNNAGNATQNRNLNKIPALNIADKQIATEFAKKRALEKGGKGKVVDAEVHKIASIDPYACCFDLTKTELLKDKNVLRLIRCLIFPSVSKKAISVPFTDKEIFERVLHDFQNNNLMNNWLDDKSIIGFARSRNYSTTETQYASQIAKVINSHTMCITDLICALKLFLDNNLQVDANGEHYSFSSEYISSFVAENHIVGIFQYVDSATLGKTIGTYQIFDLKKINTEKEVGDYLRHATNFYLPVSQYLLLGIKDEQTKKALTNSPEEIIKYVMSKSPTIKSEFEGDVGLWEKFNLGEHTESVMRFFEENFAPYLPHDTRSVMNLIILCHDIGKAASQRETIQRNSREDIANYRKYAQILCKDLGVDKSFCNFVMDFVLYTQQFTSDYYVRKDANAMANLYEVCKKLAVKYKLPEDSNLPRTLSQLARILQTCDSGAYTLYGKTRKWGTKMYYQNGNEQWTKGFVKTEQGYRFALDAKLTDVLGAKVVKTSLI